MNDELMEQIDEWHKAEKHQEIIDALEQIPEAERDFETTGLQGRTTILRNMPKPRNCSNPSGRKALKMNGGISEWDMPSIF